MRAGQFAAIIRREHSKRDDASRRRPSLYEHTGPMRTRCGRPGPSDRVDADLGGRVFAAYRAAGTPRRLLEWQAISVARSPE